MAHSKPLTIIIFRLSIFIIFWSNIFLIYSFTPLFHCLSYYPLYNVFLSSAYQNRKTNRKSFRRNLRHVDVVRPFPVTGGQLSNYLKPQMRLAPDRTAGRRHADIFSSTQPFFGSFYFWRHAYGRPECRVYGAYYTTYNHVYVSSYRVCSLGNKPSGSIGLSTLKFYLIKIGCWSII